MSERRMRGTGSCLGRRLSGRAQDNAENTSLYLVRRPASGIADSRAGRRGRPRVRASVLAPILALGSVYENHYALVNVLVDDLLNDATNHGCY